SRTAAGRGPWRHCGWQRSRRSWSPPSPAGSADVGAVDPGRLVERLRRDLGDRLREFPLEVALADGGDVLVVLRGAGSSVTALRGSREKLQPMVKRAVREL